MYTQKICHLTSVHERNDVRIFHKMCTSLVNSGFDTTLVVADGLGDEESNRIHIVDVGRKEKSRIKRVLYTVNKVLQAALDIDADIYHLHDPELIRIGRLLKKRGKIVIFDAHEDVAKQVLGKPYLNLFTKYLLHYYIKLYEAYSCKDFDLIITATETIRNKFSKINANSIDINNYPLSHEFCNKGDNQEATRNNEIVYVGAISEIRGIEHLINALEFIPHIRLNLVGKFNDSKLEARVQQQKGWKQVNYLGVLDRKEASAVMQQSKVGIVTFLGVPNHIESQPNKMFEYMSHALPLVTSNFPLWRAIVEGNQCGICVDPTNAQEIANAIQKLVNDNHLARKYAEHGYNAVLTRYNWESEEKKLINKYKELLDENFNNTWC